MSKVIRKLCFANAVTEQNLKVNSNNKEDNNKELYQTDLNESLRKSILAYTLNSYLR